MDRRKHFMLLAVGLLIIAGGNLFSRFVVPLSDFFHGCIFGVGLGLEILAVYRLKYKVE